MAVPDWPTSYGYNMFALPFSYWVGGVLYEHSHRLVASFVGFLTIILAVWLWLKDSRAWLRRLGWAALALVILQGVLGGLRVVWLKDHLGIFHATIAQCFLVLLCGIALFTSRKWQALPDAASHDPVARQSGLLLGVTLLVLAQLVLGATMRHQHAGLAIHDFPLAHGQIWPATDEASLLRYNQTRPEPVDYRPITAFHVHLHMMHRLMAFVILAAVAACAWRYRRSALRQGATTWLCLIVFQAILGVATVLSDKAADIATLHVIMGAISLAWGSLLVMTSRRMASAARGAAKLEAAMENKVAGHRQPAVQGA